MLIHQLRQVDMVVVEQVVVVQHLHHQYKVTLVLQTQAVEQVEQVLVVQLVVQAFALLDTQRFKGITNGSLGRT
jgi:hypothetical protein